MFKIAFSKILKNHLGLSLMEITIAIGLLGGVSLATMKLMTQSQQGSSDFEKSIDVMSIEKTIAVYILSENGCKQLLSSTIGSSFTIKKPVNTFNPSTGKIDTTYTDTLFEENQIIGNVRIDQMKVSALTALNTGDAGVLTVDLEFSTKDKAARFSSDSKTFKRQINVPVGMNGTAMTDCQLDKSSLYTNLIEKVCGGTFGAETDGMSCAEALAHVETRIKASVCEDVTGSIDNYSEGTGECSFNLTHAGKSCPSGKFLKGFNSAGEVVCQ